MATLIDASSTVITWEEKRILYAISDHDLSSLTSIDSSISKDLACALFGLCVPCFINAAIFYNETSKWTFNGLLNIFIALPTCAVFIYSGIFGIIGIKNKLGLVKQIKKRKQFNVLRPESFSEPASNSVVMVINGNDSEIKASSS